MENDENVDPTVEECASFEEEDVYTSAEVVAKFRQVWSNELNAPELLPTAYELVNCLVEQIKVMEQQLKEQCAVSTALLKYRAHTLEVDRIRFMLTDYLRARLRKIESLVFRVLVEDDRRQERGMEPLLSLEERDFAIEYAELHKAHFDDVLGRGTKAHREFDWEGTSAAPKLDLMVFADIGSKVIPDASIRSALTEDRRTLQPHERLLLPYSALSPSLMMGDSDATLL